MKHLRQTIFLSLALLAATLGLAPTALAQIAVKAPDPAPATQPAEKPTPRPERHAVIISVDGLRPDVALRAEMPNLRRLMARGVFTFWANTTSLGITLPSHTSMLTGVPPRIHGVDWNKDLPDGQVIYPKMPTIFEVAHKQSLTAAMVTGKSKFDALAKPDTLNWVQIPKPGTPMPPDADVATAAAAIIKEHKPNVTFVHLAQVDTTGHKIGWGTREQIVTAGRADEAIGVVVDAIEKAGIADSTLIIVTADHGGAGKTHGGDDPRTKHIPWVMVGPGVVADYDLTLRPDLLVRTEDSFRTLADYLGLEVDSKVIGQSILKVPGVCK